MSPPTKRPSRSPGIRKMKRDSLRAGRRHGNPAARLGEGALFDADRPHLLEVRDPLHDLLDPVLEERRHAVGHRLLAQVLHGVTLLDLALHLVGAHEELVDAHAPLVAAPPALPAALGTVEPE